MSIAAIREKLRHFGFFIPFRIHLLLLIISLLIAFNWLRKNNATPETSYKAILDVFITVTFWFALSILLVSFISAFFPWIIFLFNSRKQKSILKIKTPADNNLSNRQRVDIHISNIIRPFFGYIRLRLLYDGTKISPKFAPISTSSATNFFSTSMKGLYHWPLKDIREYEISRGIIYFEDFFQFFSFTATLASNSHFYTAPPIKATGVLIAQPKKTEETNERIEEMRKVEGEMLNYKNFENNDDVRRIVWKIYAKNKELVVRIPETNDPYASHIYLYISFYNAQSNDIYEEFNKAFINTFKTAAWNIYEQLSRQNVLVKYIPDQEVKQHQSEDLAQKIKYDISTAHWQKQNDLQTYFNRRYASVLCVSSFTDAKQLSEILKRSGKSLTVVFVPLSKSFAKIKVTDWLQWIFVKPEKNSSEKLQIAFTLSPLRRKLLDNEHQIKTSLDTSDCEVIILNLSSYTEMNPGFKNES